jgi:CRISPR-associated protein Cas5d
MSKPYEVFFEIAGPAAMFTRPDSGAAQVSYPAPTFSAAKGMFDSIARADSIRRDSLLKLLQDQQRTRRK